MKNKKLKIIVPILIVIEVISIFLAWKSHSDIPTLEDKKETNEVSKKQFAMYTRDSEDSDYTEYTDENNLFPKGYTLNVEQSNCMDINGDEVDTTDVISQTDDGKIMVTSTKTVYCTFYFDKKEPTASETLTTDPSSYLKQSNKGDLKWRYVGMQEEDIQGNINNYVCFGINDCEKNATNEHLYRIIGITSDGKIKIQKNSAIGTSQWWTDNTTNKLWTDSKIYTLLTGASFYTSNTYVSQDMKDKIEENHTWNTGDVTSYSNGDTVYNLEQQTKTHTGAVGLAYLSDYYFAYNEQGTQNCYNTPNCKSWMIPSDATSSGSQLWSGKSYEWTMTRYGRLGHDYDAWLVIDDGDVSNMGLSNTYAVRPVFYLKSDVKISGGEGTSSSPYIIN